VAWLEREAEGASGGTKTGLINGFRAGPFVDKGPKYSSKRRGSIPWAVEEFWSSSAGKDGNPSMGRDGAGGGDATVTRTSETGRFVGEAGGGAGRAELVAGPPVPAPGRFETRSGGNTRRDMGREDWKRRGGGPTAGR